MELRGMGRGELVKKELKTLRIEERQFQEEALSRAGFYCAVEVETLEPVRRGEEGLDATGGDPAAHDGQQAAATLILAPDAPLLGAALLGRVELGHELRAERLLELSNGGGLFFGCERRGALGLACNL